MVKKPDLLDSKEIKDSYYERRFRESLDQDRFHLMVISGIFALLMVFFGYFFFVRNSIEVVFWNGQQMDYPRLLEKVNTSTNELKTDRYLRGFKNRFIQCRFIQVDTSNEQIQACFRWLDAYTNDGGRARDLSRDLKSFTGSLGKNSVIFYGLNPNKMTIAPSTIDGELFLLSEEGTLIEKNFQGEMPQIATMYLEIRSVPVTGEKSSLGGVNIAGLKVERAYMVFQSDYLKNEETIFDLFTGQKQTRKKVN